MAYSVVFAPEAEADLLELYDYIARHGGPDRALRYVERVVATCRCLAVFPECGAHGDDIRAGPVNRRSAERVSSLAEFGSRTGTGHVALSLEPAGGSVFACAAIGGRGGQGLPRLTLPSPPQGAEREVKGSKPDTSLTE